MISRKHFSQTINATFIKVYDGYNGQRTLNLLLNKRSERESVQKYQNFSFILCKHSTPKILSFLE